MGPFIALREIFGRIKIFFWGFPAKFSCPVLVACNPHAQMLETHTACCLGVQREKDKNTNIAWPQLKLTIKTEGSSEFWGAVLVFLRVKSLQSHSTFDERRLINSQWSSLGIIRIAWGKLFNECDICGLTCSDTTAAKKVLTLYWRVSHYNLLLFINLMLYIINCCSGCVCFLMPP